MSSTHLLHSLSLLLLPLRCRRNCHQIVSLAIILLSALSARIPRDQGRRRGEAREEEEEAAKEEERQADRREGVQGEEEEDTPYIVANPHPILTSSGTTSSARATGTGAALTSWQSSHSHRSPGAQDRDRCQDHKDLRAEHLLYPKKPQHQQQLQLLLTKTAPATASRGAPTTHRSRSSRIQISSSSTKPAHCSWTAGASVASIASIAT